MSSTAVAKLEPFILMAKSAKGVAATKLIESATAAPGVFVFSELLDSPNIQELAGNPQLQPHLTLLQIFSYGTYDDYNKSASSLPPLNQAQLTKLKQLSIITYAADRRLLPYNYLMSLLEIKSIRALEDLIIDAMYAELVRGKLDQKKQQFEVQYTSGRDLRPGQLEQLLGSLRAWSDRTQAVLTALDNKLSSIDNAEQQSKQDLLVYDQQRQATVNEILNANNNGKNGNSASNSSGLGFGKGYRLGSAENLQGGSRYALGLNPHSATLAALNTGLDYYPSAGGTLMLQEDPMDLDEPVPSSPSKKKAAALTPTSSTAPRKRVRGGQ